MLVKIIEQAPVELVESALNELKEVRWDEYNHASRASGVFATSKTIHLRKHTIPPGVVPVTVDDYGKLVDTEETIFYDQFPENVKLANWIYHAVNGQRMGRIMIVNLLPFGEVKHHIDPGKYFEVHSRFHVPLKTNADVLFSGAVDSQEHMPYGTLCQLNNRVLHGLKNNNRENRIHIIVDIAVNGGNHPFS